MPPNFTYASRNCYRHRGAYIQIRIFLAARPLRKDDRVDEAGDTPTAGLLHRGFGAASCNCPSAARPETSCTIHFSRNYFLSFHAHFKLLTPVPCRPCSFGACCCSLWATPAELAPLVAGKKAGPAACIVSDLDVVHVSPAKKIICCSS